MNQAGLTVIVDWDDAKVQAGINNLKKTVNDLGLSNFGVDSSGAIKGIGAAKSAMQDLKATVKGLKDDYQSLLAQGLSPASREASAASNIYNAFNNRLKEINRTTNGTEDAYSRLSRIANEATRHAQNLGVIYGTNSEQFKNASGRANALTQRLKDLDAATGRNGRNVGNYASGYNALSVNISRLVGEMPNFAQSLRIGFMSISNNFQPIKESIDQIILKNKELRAEGKPTKSVLGEISGSLFSWNTALLVGITALTAYGPRLIEWIRGTNDAAEATKRLAARKKELDQIDENAYQQTGKNIGQLTNFLSILQNENTSHEAKLGILKKLRDQYPTLLGKMDEHALKSGELANVIIQKLIPAIEAEGRVMALNDKVANNYGKRIDLKYKQIQAEKDYGEALQKSNAASAEAKKFADAQQGYGFITGNTSSQQRAAGRALDDLADKAKAYRSIRTETVELEKESSFLQKEQAANIGDLNKAAAAGLSGFKDTASYLSKSKDKISESANAAKEFANSMSELQSRIKDGLISPIDAASERIKILSTYYGKLTGDLKQNPESPFVKNIASQLRDAQDALMKFNAEARKLDPNLGKRASESLYESLAKIRDLTIKQNPMLQLEVGVQFNSDKVLSGAQVPEALKQFTKNFQDGVDKAKKDAQRQIDGMIHSLSGSLTQGFVSLGESIGNVLSGMQNPFDGIVSFLGDAIQSFGKQLIELGGLMELAKKAISLLSVSGVGAIVAGVGLVALGQLLKNSAQKGQRQTFSRFADGGIVYGPTMGLMGEYPGASSNPEVIAPLNKLKDIMGSTNNAYSERLVTEIDGRKLKLILQRQDSFDNR